MMNWTSGAAFGTPVTLGKESWGKTDYSIIALSKRLLWQARISVKLLTFGQARESPVGAPTTIQPALLLIEAGALKQTALS
jgi:hypothetical protein